MTPQQLRISILQSAVKGKIVEHGSEKSLINEINTIRNSINYKKKKMDRVFIDDYPYDIPDNWIWVRLGEVAEVIRGLTFSKSSKNHTDDSILVLRGGNIDSKTEDLIYDDNIYVDKTIPKEEQYLKKGDCLIVASSGTKSSVGKSCYVDSIPEYTSFGGFMMVIRSGKYIDSKLLSYHIKLYRQKIISDTAGYISNITNSILNNLLIPLPPLTEQKRIVSKIEELLPYVDRYAEAYEKLEQFNAKFPEDMKKSILQYAIQGKLVEQRPEEGTAEELYQQIQDEKQKLIKEGKIKKEKPLAEISEDDSPFDIPDSWKWCYLGDVFSHTAGKALNSKNTNGIKYKYITTSNVYWDHFDLDNLKEMYYTEDEIEKYSVKYGDLLVLEGGDVGRSAIWNLQESYCIQNHIHRLRPYADVVVKYFYYAMMYFKLKGGITGKGIGIKGLSANALHCICVPLPPLREQRRIVAKIEELLPYCDRLG